MNITSIMIGAGGWLLIGALAVAQGPSDPAATLEAARIASEIEGDAETAIDLYGQVTRNPSASAELREHADFEAALLARRLGRGDEAAAILKKLAAGTTRWARRAQDVLAGKMPQDPRIAARVHRAIEKLYTDETQKEGSADLQLIGGPAAPYLAEAIRNDKGDLTFTSRAVGVLTAIGGDAAAEFFRSVVESDDLIYRRTVARAIKGLKGTGSGNAKQEPILGRVREFLRDDDAQVRESVMGYLMAGNNVISVDEGIALLTDPELSIRTRFAPYMNWLQGVEGGDVLRVTRAIDEGLVGLSGQAKTRLLSVYTHASILGTRVGLERFLDQCESNADIKSQGSPWMAWNGSTVSDMPAAERLSPEDLTARVARLRQQLTDTEKPSPVRDHRGVCFMRILFALSESWTHDDLEEVLELHRAVTPFVVDDDLEELIFERLLRPEDVSLLAPIMNRFVYTAHLAIWLEKKVGPKPELAAPLAAWFDARLADEKTDWNRRWSGMNRMVKFASRIPDEGLQRRLVEMVKRVTNYYDEVADGFMEVNAGGRPVVELMTLSVPEPNVSVRRKRALLIRRLIRAGDPAAAASGAIPAAIEAGVEPPYRAGRPHGNLLPPFSDWGFDFEQSVEILEACLALENKVVWGFVQPGEETIPEAFQPVVARNLLSAPEDLLDDAARLLMPTLVASREPELIAVFDALVVHPVERVRSDSISRLVSLESSPRIAAAVLKALDDPSRRVVDSAAQVAGRHRIAAAAPKLEALLEARPSTRVIQAYAELKGDEAIDVIGRFLEDGSFGYRRSACVALGRMESRAAAKYLIRALRDADTAVREQAQKSLEELQFFLDQKSRWETWSKGAGLDQPSAAAALIDQAKSGKKAVRIAAIDSLGTLAQPTTLPFLIKLMGDEDADVASAAKGAVDKINGKTGGSEK